MLPFNMLMSQTILQHLSTGKGTWHKQQCKYKDATCKNSLLETFGMFTVQILTNALQHCVLAFNPTSPHDASGPTRSSQMN